MILTETRSIPALTEAHSLRVTGSPFWVARWSAPRSFARNPSRMHASRSNVGGPAGCVR